MDEFALIRWIRDRTAGLGRPGLGIGDDCAGLVFKPGAEVLVTTDMLLDGRHFVVGEAAPEAIGRKCLGVNLSDIAAMAGVPVAAFVSVALPRQGAVELARGLVEGMAALAREFGVSIAGGDTNAWDGPLVVNVAVLGEATARGAVRRSGARPGDAVIVTGPLGGSLLGRHLDPRPRVREAIAIHEAAPIHAMLDVSDGLAADLGHILAASGVGATLDATAIPIHPDAVERSRITGRPALEHAFHDGEDFELCLALDPADAARLGADPALTGLIRRVGTFEAEPGLRLRGPDGSVAPLVTRGFNHLDPDPLP